MNDGLVSDRTAIVTLFLPFIEWRADYMPVRRMGVIGVVMILSHSAQRHPILDRLKREPDDTWPGCCRESSSQTANPLPQE
jgi:hypothetical protein